MFSKGTENLTQYDKNRLDTMKFLEFFNSQMIELLIYFKYGFSLQ